MVNAQIPAPATLSQQFFFFFLSPVCPLGVAVVRAPVQLAILAIPTPQFFREQSSFHPGFFFSFFFSFFSSCDRVFSA
ncbi:hypothetical protein LZ32DRAFT_238631 [Colletotrichum eremochloae]|nr:hypothetical protein LZ32DRAFT_238631 [Colletotrichum eremochloae]